MCCQVGDGPDGHITLVYTKNEAEMKNALLVVIGHVQHNHALSPAREWQAQDTGKDGSGNKSVDLQRVVVIKVKDKRRNQGFIFQQGRWRLFPCSG